MFPCFASQSSVGNDQTGIPSWAALRGEAQAKAATRCDVKRLRPHALCSASKRRGSPLCHRLPVTNKPALNSFCRCMSREGDLPLLAAVLRASICSCAVQCVAIRHGFMPRDRSGFTSKTLPHVHQPYVVKVSPTPRHVLRRAATRDLAIPCISYRCCASRSDSTPLNRPPVTNKPAPHLGQPYVVKPGFLPRS